MDENAKLPKTILDIKKYLALYKIKSEIKNFEHFKCVPTNKRDYIKYLNYNIKYLKSQFNDMKTYEEDVKFINSIDD